jgi:hypothetical protein
VALQAELDEDWEAAPEFRFGQHLPIPEESTRSFWAWYDAHQADVMLRKRLLVFVVTVQVRHLRRLFEAVFGQHP